MTAQQRSHRKRLAQGTIGALLCLSSCLHLANAQGGAPRQSFHPGALWPDNNGVHINAHGGGMLHHDAGSLGAAVPDDVLERRLRLMQNLGANAIRTSHNPPAPELSDMCDRLGLLVQEEAFDEFTPPKNKWVRGRNVGRAARYGYAEYFEQWAVRDIQDMVRRDRNHPSIIMWSIGNEIDYPNDPFTHPVLGDQHRPTHPPAEQLLEHGRRLVTAVKEIDDTRPVTAALAAIQMTNAVGFPELLDVVGYNYQESRYAEDHQRYSDRVIYGGEVDYQDNVGVAYRGRGIAIVRSQRSPGTARNTLTAEGLEPAEVVLSVK